MQAVLVENNWEETYGLYTGAQGQLHVRLDLWHGIFGE